MPGAAPEQLLRSDPPLYRDPNLGRLSLQRSFKEVVTEVLHANDIVDVLQGAVHLQSAGGGRFKGLCPFHQEKTPSFTVNQQWQTYKCFGCDKHGDAITFLREHEGLTFGEALRKLADRGGVRLPDNYADGYGDDGTRAKVLEFLTAAESFYRSTLSSPLKGHAAKAYLDTRAFKPETIKRFGLGAATSEWSDLFNFGKERKDLSFEVMEAAGLIKKNDYGYRDLFRNRLMFPIRDVTGRIVAFGGRDLGGGEPKYINSPETTVYKKSRVLYGLYEGREALRQSKRALLVEGYFDVLRCFEAGFEIAVAPCGTALTPEQAQLLSRYVEEVVVLFDGDDAGIRAAIKAVGILVGAGLAVTVLVLPDGADPDDYIRDHGADAFTTLLGEATDFVRFFVRKNANRTGTIEGRAAIAKELFEIIAEMKDELRRDEYVRLLAGELNVDPWACRRDFDAYLRDRGNRKAMAAAAQSEEAPARAQFDAHHHQLISIVLNDAGCRTRLRTALQDIEMEPSPLAEVLYAVLSDNTERAGARHFESDEARQLFADAANTTPPSGVDYGMVVDDWIRKLTCDARKREAQQLQVQLEEAQRVKDMPRAFELASKRALLEMEIRRLGAA